MLEIVQIREGFSPVFIPKITPLIDKLKHSNSPILAVKICNLRAQIWVLG